MLRMDKFAQGKFSLPVNPKDGYAVADCEDPRERNVLEFVVLILYLEKPTRITVTLSNTIFGAFFGGRKMSWELIMHELVEKLVYGLEKGNPLPSALIFSISTASLSVLERERLLC